MNLFTYGTLMDREIFAAVAGCSRPGCRAVLPGYARFQVCGEVYPAIRSGDGSVEGILYQAVDELALQRCDRFEGAEYARRTVMVRTAEGRCEEAQVYVFATDQYHRLSADDWNFAAFLRRHKRTYLQACEASDADTDQK